MLRSCIDCGTMFETLGRSTRCAPHQKQHDKGLAKEKQRRENEEIKESMAIKNKALGRMRRW